MTMMMVTKEFDLWSAWRLESLGRLECFPWGLYSCTNSAFRNKSCTLLPQGCPLNSGYALLVASTSDFARTCSFQS
jgi:hypothetical protein